MPIRELTLGSLKHLDFGKADEAFKLHLKRATLDCLDRPADDKARTVTLQVELKPILEPGGDCVELNAQMQVTSKMPTHKTKVYSVGPRKNGSLVFNEDSPSNINQTTFLEGEEESE